MRQDIDAHELTQPMYKSCPLFGEKLWNCFLCSLSSEELWACSLCPTFEPARPLTLVISPHSEHRQTPREALLAATPISLPFGFLVALFGSTYHTYVLVLVQGAFYWLFSELIPQVPLVLWCVNCFYYLTFQTCLLIICTVHLSDPPHSGWRTSSSQPPCASSSLVTHWVELGLFSWAWLGLGFRACLALLFATVTNWTGCCGLNGNGLRRLIYFSILAPVGRLLKRLTRRGLIGGDVSLGVGFEVSRDYPRLTIPFPAACGSDTSSQLLLWCHVCLRAPSHDANALTLGIYEQPSN